MKILSFLLIIPLFIFSCSNEKKEKPKNDGLLSTDLVNNPRSANGTDEAALKALATMDFKDTLHDFGSIKQGEVVSYNFEFTNSGKEPLIISRATGSCGCTVADYPRDPIPPMTQSLIKVQFSSIGKHGHQEKSVSLITNAVRGTYVLYIKGDVEEKKE